MRILAFLLIAFSSTLIINAQNLLDTKVPDLIDHDFIGHYYTVNDEEVIQFDMNRNVLNRFSSKANGEISEIDASNALKILVHYRSLTALQFLDNRLGERSDLLDLQEVGMEQSHITCSSYNNGVWVYDKVSLNLIRLDQNMRISLKSGNLNQITGRIIEPLKMREDGRWLYMLDEAGEIVVCDIYGAYSRTLRHPSIIDMNLDGRFLYISNQEGIWKYNELTKTFEIVFSKKGIQMFSIAQKHILYIDDKGLWSVKL